MTPEKEVQAMIAQALRVTLGNLQELADEVGVSYASIRAWADGRRNPTPENLAALADALERRGGELKELAEQLRQVTGLESS